MGLSAAPLGLLARTRFQDLFHSPHRGAFHRSLAVLSAIGRCRYFALGCGHPCFRRPSTAAAVLAYHTPAHTPSPTGLSPSAELPSSQLRLDARVQVAPCREAPMAAQPRTCVGCSPHAHARFGLVRVRSPLLAELFLLLGVLRCFSSPGSPPSAYKFSGGCRPMTGSGLPHSDTHGSTRTRPLPVAFRCPSRPSSACNAKASPTYVFSLTEIVSVSHSHCAAVYETGPTGGAGPRIEDRTRAQACNLLELYAIVNVRLWTRAGSNR